MSQKDEKKSSKKAAAVAAAAAIALLLAGTYAWTDYSQHKSNEFSSGEMSNYDVTLVEDFEEVTDWQEGEEAVKKIYVKNNSLKDTEDEELNGSMYVRLQLREYFENGDIQQEFSTQRYMIDTEGKFITASETLSGQDALDYIKTTYSEPRYETITMADLVKDQGMNDSTQKWYVITKGGDPNGQYGKFLLKSYTYDVASMVPNVNRSYDAYNEATHHSHENGECEYTIHLWGDTSGVPNCAHGFHDYISWQLGDDVVFVSSWDGDYLTKTAKWYLDESTGWAYWGELLQPGEETSLLMKKVTLDSHPGTDYFYYAIHTDMEAISKNEKFEPDDEKSEDPEITEAERRNIADDGVQWGYTIIGEGTPFVDSEITVIIDGQEYTTDVGYYGGWMIEITEIQLGRRLEEGDVIYAYQTEEGKTKSDTIQYIIPSWD